MKLPVITTPSNPVHLSWPTEPGGALAAATWSAWSCTVRVVVADPDALEPAVRVVTALMGRVERVASRFVVESDLSWANANQGRPTAVPLLLVDLVSTALDGARRSGGALDPTVGRDVIRAGYDRDILLVTDSDEDIAAPPARADRPTWRDVRVDPRAGLLTVPRGAALDLGATAKAQTADLAAAAISAQLGSAALVEIGGDLAVAGSKADWQVDVAERRGAPGRRLTVNRGGLATSTTTVRTWRRGSHQVHHIIDPRTGGPAQGPWRTVSVAASSAQLANVCSTAALVLGASAETWLREQSVAARLVDQGGAVTCLGGWPAEPRVPSAGGRG